MASAHCRTLSGAGRRARAIAEIEVTPVLRSLLDGSARRACRRALLRRFQLALFSVSALLGFAMAATGPTAFITDWPGYVQQPRVQTEAKTSEKRPVQRRGAARPPRHAVVRPPPPPRPHRPEARPRLLLPAWPPPPPRALPAWPLPAPPAGPIVVRGPPVLLA